MAEKMWTCLSCTLENKDVAVCSACGSQRQESQKKNNLKNGAFPSTSCQQNGFKTGNQTNISLHPGNNGNVINVSSDEEDEVIEVDSSGNNIKQNSLEWKCKRCTLLNPHSKNRCQVCDSPRRSRLPTLSDVDPDFTEDNKPKYDDNFTSKMTHIFDKAKTIAASTRNTISAAFREKTQQDQICTDAEPNIPKTSLPFEPMDTS